MDEGHQKEKHTTMLVTTQTPTQKLAAFLHHEISPAQLVDWAKTALLDGEFAGHDTDALRIVVTRLGVAGVRAFGLTWADCENLFDRFGCFTAPASKF